MYHTLVHMRIIFVPVKKGQGMKWTDYMKKYSDEESCKRERKKYRDQVGVICPHCGSKDHY